MRAGEVCLVGGGGDGARETVHNWPSLWHFPHNEQTAGWSMLGLVLAAKGPGSDAQNSTNHPPSPANQPAARPRPDQWRSWRPLRRVRATARGSWSLAESGDMEPLHGPGWRSLLLSSACNLLAMTLKTYFLNPLIFWLLVVVNIFAKYFMQRLLCF